MLIKLFVCQYIIYLIYVFFITKASDASSEMANSMYNWIEKYKESSKSVKQ